MQRAWMIIVASLSLAAIAAYMVVNRYQTSSVLGSLVIFDHWTGVTWSIAAPSSFGPQAMQNTGRPLHVVPMAPPVKVVPGE